MRIVIDTNIIASAIFFGGRPRQLLEKVLMRELDAYISKDILEEYYRTLDKLQAKYSNKKVIIPIAQIASALHMIEPKTVVKVCRDPYDDMFIACAVDSASLYIVSGDNDLLSIRQYGDIQIVTVAEFFERYWRE